MPSAARHNFVGPQPPSAGTSSLSENDLLAAFATAQRQSTRTLPAWIDHKVQRKEVWQKLGVPSFLLVPTLYTGALECDEAWTSELPQFVPDDERNFVPCLDAGKALLKPADEGCRETLRTLLLRHGQIVIKPATGANSKGVLLLSTSATAAAIRNEAGLVAGKLQNVRAAAASEHGGDDSGGCDAVDGDEGSTDARPRVWVGSPLKTWRSGANIQSLAYPEVWSDLIIGNDQLRGDFLVEPTIPHDQEVCVLAINGGELLLLAGRSLVMERLVRHTKGGEPHVAESDFETPEWLRGSSIRSWRRADVATRQRHTQWILTQRVEGDAAGRSIAQVLLDTTELLASTYFDGTPSSALRVDFFVRWAGSGGDARVWVNEVEHGFNPLSLIGWYGARLVLSALTFWSNGNGGEHDRAAHLNEVMSADGLLMPPSRLMTRIQAHEGRRGQGDRRRRDWVTVLCQPVDGRPLCAFRAAFGILMAVHAVRLHVHGMYERAVRQPALHFPYQFFGMDIVPPLPTSATGELVHLCGLTLAALGIALRMWPRLCASVFFVAYTAFVLSDRTIFNNHYYLYSLIALLLALCGADAPVVPRWHRALFRLQVVIVYAYAGVAKMHADWLVHHQPMATKLVDEAATYNPLFADVLRLPDVAQLVSLGGAAFDVVIGPLLLWGASTRQLAFALTIAFHLTNHLIWPLGEFPTVMMATNIIFCDAIPAPLLALPRVRRWLHAPPEHQPSVRVSHVALSLGALHTIIQLLLPLQAVVVHGTDLIDATHVKTHTLLSWRMMAVSTRNFVSVSLRSDELGASVEMTRTYNRLYLHRLNGSRELIPLTPYLEPRQAGYMPYSPHMLLRFARDAAVRRHCHVAHDGCKVVGDLWSAINGRPLQRFVDPDVDLATATIPWLARPLWVRPLLAEFGNSTWRSRINWLRTRLRATNHTIACLADVPGGSFYESFPVVDPFPARALVVPLQGQVAVDVIGEQESTAEVLQTQSLEPPHWSEPMATHVTMAPRSAPAGVPFGRRHRVRSLDRSLWCYVFGVEPTSDV